MERHDLGHGAWLDYEADFLPNHREWMARLLEEVDLRVETLRMFGREVPVPRRVAYHGDPGCTYRYSGVDHDPAPWTPALTEIRERLVALTGTPYDAVLVNHYRDGQDSMGRHADDEAELGPSADDIRIASVSVGHKRVLRFRPKSEGSSFDYQLGEGDLLIMGGTTQQHFVHELVRTRKPVGPRLNLTFRCVQSFSGPKRTDR